MADFLFLHQLETSMNSYDVKSSDHLLIQLEGYEFTDEKKALFEELKISVSQLDAERTSLLCGKLIQ